MDRLARQQYIDKMMKDIALKSESMGTVHIERTSPSSKSMDVLMIEDDVMSIDALKKAMEQTGYRYNLVSVDSTESALRYLNRSTPYTEMPIPDVIFIDMCSEKINSADILNFINSERVLKEIPTFTAFEDVKIMNNTIIEDLSYSCKMKKPFTPKKVKECLLEIGKLWHLTGTRNLALGHG